MNSDRMDFFMLEFADILTCTQEHHWKRTRFFYVFFVNPEVENKIFKELCKIRATLGERQSSSWKMFEAEEIEGLVYLHAALRKGMRLFPPVPLNHKCASKEDELPIGHKV